jgi:hypothetical protein
LGGLDIALGQLAYVGVRAHRWGHNRLTHGSREPLGLRRLLLRPEYRIGLYLCRRACLCRSLRLPQHGRG